MSAEERNIQIAIIKPQVDKALMRLRRYQGITVGANPVIRLLHNDGPVLRTVVHGVFVANCKDSQMKNVLALLSTRDDRPPFIVNRLDDLERNDSLIEWLKPHLHLDEESYRLKIFSLGTQRYTLNQVYEQMREWQIAKVERDIDALVKTSTEVYIEFFKNLGGLLLQFLAFPLTFLGLAGVPYMVTTGLVAFAVLGLAPTLISYLAADTPAEREALGQELEAMVISELFGLFLGKITAPILKGIGNGLSTSVKKAKELVIDLQQRADRNLYSKLTNPGEEVTKKLNSSVGKGRLTSTQKNILNGINDSLGKNIKPTSSVGVSHTENIANLMTGSYDYQFKGNFQALVQEILKDDEGN